MVCGNDSDPDGGYGFEYISQICVSLQNFISKDPATFLSTYDGETFIARTFRFIERSLKINATSEHMLDGVVIMKVLMAMLENLKGRIDEALPHVLRVCLGQFVECKPTKHFASMIMQTVAMCFWYNAALTFQVLEQAGATQDAFLKLFHCLPTLKHDFEYRRLIFGLTSILSLSPQQMPTIIADKLPLITKEVVDLA